MSTDYAKMFADAWTAEGGVGPAPKFPCTQEQYDAFIADGCAPELLELLAVTPEDVA